jgi:hypothetical protein
LEFKKFRKARIILFLGLIFVAIFGILILKFFEHLGFSHGQSKIISFIFYYIFTTVYFFIGESKVSQILMVFYLVIGSALIQTIGFFHLLGEIKAGNILYGLFCIFLWAVTFWVITLSADWVSKRFVNKNNSHIG